MDVARGFAILGVLWLNVFIFALPFEVLVIPAAWGDANTLNTAIWDAVSVGVTGVMRGMIAILFGASALLMLQGAEQSAQGFGGLDRFFRRLLWLIVFGLIHGYILLWPHDILYVYGVLGLLIFPFRNLGIRQLALAACVMFAGSIFTTANTTDEIQQARSKIEQNLGDEELQDLREGDPLIENYEDSRFSPGAQERGFTIHLASAIQAPSKTAAEEQEDREIEEMVERIGQEIAERQSGYFANVKSLAANTFAEQTQEMFSTHFFDVGSFFFIGMFLFRSGFLTCEWSQSAYIRCLLAGYAVGLVLGFLDRFEFENESFLNAFSIAIADYTYDLRRLGFAVGYLSTLALAVKLGRFRWAIGALADCGRLALSLYVGQTIVCNFIFLGFGLGQFGLWEHYEIAVLGLVLTTLQLVAAPLYLKRYGQGPLEKLLRWLVGYGLETSVTQKTAQPSIN